jgi:hypothetical protein
MSQKPISSLGIEDAFQYHNTEEHKALATLTAIQTFTAAQVFDATTTPIKAKVSGADMFQVNQYGVGIGNVAPSNTDDFVHIERNVDTSTGILIYNRNVHTNADSFIHLFSDSNDLRITVKGSVAGNLINLSAQSAGSFNLLTNNAAPIEFYTNNVKRASLSGAGDFTLGSTTLDGTRFFLISNLHSGSSAQAVLQMFSDGPTFQIFVKSVAAGNFINLYGSGANSGMNLFNASNSPVAIWTNNTQRLTVLADGKVGIGTASPGSKLSIVGLPTSAAGLSAGDIWSNGGVLTVV